MAHSLAIITDAAHLLSDVSGFAVAALAAYWAKRRSQEHFSYGYHRMEVGGWVGADGRGRRVAQGRPERLAPGPRAWADNARPLQLGSGRGVCAAARSAPACCPRAARPRPTAPT